MVESTDPTTSPNLLTKVTNSVTSLSTLLLLTSVVAYSIGFMAVHSYLSKWGIVPYDLLQPNYISAGLLYLMMTVGLTGIIWWLHTLKHRNEQDKAAVWDVTSWIIWWVFSVATYALPSLWPVPKDVPPWQQYTGIDVTIVAGLIALWGHKYLYRVLRLRSWLENGFLAFLTGSLMLVAISLRFGFTTFLFYPIFLIAIYMFYQFLSENRKEIKLFKTLIEGGLYGLGAMVTSIYLFGIYYYPAIPTYYGGGKPVLISLILNPENGELVGKALNREDWKCVMQNIAVIHENSEVLYVLPYGVGYEEPAVAIPKREILGTIYQKVEMPENYSCGD